MNQELLQKRLREFQPEALIESSYENDENFTEIGMIDANDASKVDLARANYLNLLHNKQVQKAAEDVIRVYGMGTCGPQTFYGTTDKHEEIEQKLAQFLHMEESIVFSYGFMALSSTITAFCKQGDLVFVDEKVNYPIEHGLELAKSTIIKFAHNSAANFEKQLKSAITSMPKNGRLFIILEAISWQTGQVCQLLDFLPICEKYKIRVFLDETYSIGILGETGRGLLQHFDCDPTRIDVIFGTLEGAIGSVGGFGSGSGQMMSQLRIGGVGWLFSASIPTYMIAVALKAIEDFGNLPTTFRKLTVDVHHVLADRCHFEVMSDEIAPFKVFRTRNNERVYNFCRQNGVYFIYRKDGDMLMINVSVRLLDEGDKYKKVVDTLEKAAHFL